MSPGVAVARVCLFNEQRHNNLPLYRVERDRLDHEKARVERALALAAARLQEIAGRAETEIGKSEAAIFDAQRMMLEDPGLVDEILANVGTAHLNAEAAVSRTLDAYEAKLRLLDDQYLRERASDIGEIKRRALDVLRDTDPALQCAGDEHCRQGRDRIIVTETLTPGLTVDVDVSHTRGLVTHHGGPTSHAAILARALGIPAVSGIAGIHEQVSCGTELLVDGGRGIVIVHPTAATVRLVGSPG